MPSNHNNNVQVKVFSTCPPSYSSDQETYVRRVCEIARWSEEFGCTGILVYTDNSLLDPWHVAQIIIENTRSLNPLVAVQPVYMHPYWIAKKITTLAYLYQRRVYLNMVAGGFRNDLLALNDTTPHDKRYVRLTEYTNVIQQLLASPSPVSYEGEFYKVKNLRMTPPLPSDLFPGIVMSGTSDAGSAAAREIGATAIKYPKPASEEHDVGAAGNRCESGVRVGIIARDDEDKAWRIAHARFPADRKGQITHGLAMKTSDSEWHKQLSEMAEKTKENRNPYWLFPFENYKTFCPYLVGTYGRVGEELGRYIALGYKTFILDIPPNEEELRHTGIAFERASQQVA